MRSALALLCAVCAVCLGLLLPAARSGAESGSILAAALVCAVAYAILRRS